MTEPGLASALIAQIGRLTLRTLAAYAIVVILAFAGLTALQADRALARSADVIESLLGLYADPGGEPTVVAPAMLAEQLTGVGSRFVITRRMSAEDEPRRVYHLSPGMPAKEIAGLAADAGDAVVRDVILGALRARRWQVQVYHRTAGEFDIFVAASRSPLWIGLAGLTAAAVLLLPIGVGLARGATRRAVTASLGPVERVRRATAAISPGDLSQRVPVPTGLVETTEIATAVNRLVERVEVAQRTLAGFTADASHELRTPLTFLRAQAQWVLDGSRSPEAIREAVAAITTEAERMHRLVEGLLLLARGDNRGLTVEPVPFAVGPLVSEVAEIATGMAAGTPLVVEVTGAEGIMVLGVEEHARQVLLNLVANAVRYSARGTITIAVVATGGTVAVSVADEGEGIAAEHLPRIFDRFYRVEASRSRRHGGTGLGLAIARMLATIQGGGLEVESTVGRGSRFTLRLPAAPSGGSG